VARVVTSLRRRLHGLQPLKDVKGLAALLLAASLCACARRTPQEIVLGNWTVVGHVFAPINAMPPDEADGWNGSRAEFAPRRAWFRDRTCTTPGYMSWTTTGAQFERDYRISPSALGITSGDIEMVRIDCRGPWTVPGSELIIVADDKLVTLWDGVYFLLRRAPA
jgi:hypothetical protein